MENEYYYNETITRFYDTVYENPPQLIAGMKYYLDEINNTNGAVLEAGVGTGRIFLPALATGADMYGFDYSEKMLARLKEKLPAKEHHRVWNADMRRFDSGMSYSLVISPFRVFQHMLTIDDQLNALNSIYNVLEPGGMLIFDVFYPDLKRITHPLENVLEFDGEYLPGHKLQRFFSVKYDNLIQQMDLNFKFIWEEGGQEKTDTFSTKLRYYFRYELENLIGRTNFKLEKIYGDFKRSELNSKSSEFIVMCRK
ncbi:MAG: class I SAM-dependent methyltransferase [Ignavibacteria bacterium]|nr:class I SAM-dependent methyltransferase [Ignavibacteria bacterium]